MSGTINVIPSNITLTADLEGGLLDNIGANATVTANLKSDLLDKIKATLDADLKSDLLDKIKATIAADLKSDLLDKIKADANVTASIKELAPLLLTLLWTEIPMVKFASPHRYELAFRVFGFRIFAIELHGESKAVTAKNPHAATGDIHV
jgi:hypothetical protein